jgi:hypothetical protein
MFDKTSPPIVKRRDAKAAGAKRYFTGKPCPKGHVDERWTGSGSCCRCVYLKVDARQKADPVRRREYERQWRAKNPEKQSEKSRRQRARHGDRLRAANRAYYKARPEYNRRKTAAYNAAKKRAMPPWLTPEHLAQIAAAYAEAHETSQRTGVLHDVDHEVPVRGRSVCGLHVPWNLRVLPASVNRGKGNRHGTVGRSVRPKSLITQG